ncbi:MAG TPA: DUF192 domain-containing protein [Longimicrobiales bacterium]|nr:DUF192 domain-containing protein [Longimicrobiales bacterium]
MRALRAVLVMACTLAACAAPAADDAADGEQPPVELTAPEFESAAAHIVTGADTILLRVELARTVDQQAFGLMDRDSLPQDAGMIFLYEQQQAGQSAFYMYRTRIPLDIAFFDGAGRISAILQMVPCTSAVPDACPRYAPNAPYFGALEVNRGFMQQHGVAVGDRIVLPGRIGG